MFLASSLGTGQRECHHHTATLGGKGSGSVCVPVVTHTIYRGYSWATSRPMSIATNEPRKLCVTAGLSPTAPRRARAGDSNAPRSAMGVPGCPWVPLGAEGHMAAPPPPAVPMKGNSEERGININELICTERLSLIPQLHS